MTRRFALFTDQLQAGAQLAGPPRAISIVYVVSGAVALSGARLEAGAAALLPAGGVLSGAGKASVLRWQIGFDAATGALLDLEVGLPPGRPMVRLDQVALGRDAVTPPHRHAGPGLRYLQDGTIAASIGTASMTLASGMAWLERMDDLIIGRAGPTGARFLRCFILPDAYRGRSSYVPHPPGSVRPDFEVRYTMLIDGVTLEQPSTAQGSGS